MWRFQFQQISCLWAGKQSPINVSWSNSYLKTFVIFRELGQDLLHASHLKEEPKKKKKLITELLLFFLLKIPLLFMISLPCGSDLLLLQHLLSSLPSPKHSQSEGSLGRRNQTNCSHSSRLVWSLEMLQRGSPCREGLLWAWRGIGLHMTQCALCHGLSVVSQMYIKGERGNKQGILKIPSWSCRPWASAAFWKKKIISKAKLSHVQYCKRRKDSQEAGKGCRACNGKFSLSHWAVLL